ncbi:MAG: DNA-binding glycosylase/AP lyase [Frankiales bacterium]|nr:DNA-binding glycosylase/AP lyase [Frankiales bacterium]
MPEGDTVYRQAKRMNNALAGQVITRSDFRVPQLATTDLVGRTLLEVASRGKHLLHRFSDDLTLHTHLRMDGDWQVRSSPFDERRITNAFEIRAILGTASAAAVGWRLPVIELLRTRDEEKAVGHLGPDLLGADWDPDEAVRRLQANPDSTAADALMEQRNLAGIGNVFKNELLFLRGLHPDTHVGAINDVRAVVDLAHKLLVANKDRLVRVTTGDPRRGRNVWVYGRAGRECYRCGTTLRPHTHGVATQVTSTTFCPRCQPEGGGGRAAVHATSDEPAT